MQSSAVRGEKVLIWVCGILTQVTAVIPGAVGRLALISFFARELGVWGYSFWVCIADNVALQCKCHFSGKVLKSWGVCEQPLTW